MEKVKPEKRNLTLTVVPGVPMIKKYFKRLIIVNKEAILMEVLAIKGLMQLLMKTRNTDEKWTREERKEIKTHLKNMYRKLHVRSREQALKQGKELDLL
jgi:hypothetical protein